MAIILNVNTSRNSSGNHITSIIIIIYLIEIPITDFDRKLLQQYFQQLQI